MDRESVYLELKSVRVSSSVPFRFLGERFISSRDQRTQAKERFRRKALVY